MERKDAIHTEQSQRSKTTDYLASFSLRKYGETSTRQSIHLEKSEVNYAKF